MIFSVKVLCKRVLVVPVAMLTMLSLFISALRSYCDFSEQEVLWHLFGLCSGLGMMFYILSLAGNPDVGFAEAKFKQCRQRHICDLFVYSSGLVAAWLLVTYIARDTSLVVLILAIIAFLGLGFVHDSFLKFRIAAEEYEKWLAQKRAIRSMD